MKVDGARKTEARHSSSPSWVFVSLLRGSQGPTHSMTTLVKARAIDSKVTVITASQHAVDVLREIPNVRVVKMSFASSLPSRIWGLLSILRTIRKECNLLGETSEPILLANSIGAGFRCALARPAGAALGVFLRSEYMTWSYALKIRILDSLFRDIAFIAVSPFVQGLLYGNPLCRSVLIDCVPNAVPDELFEFVQPKTPLSADDSQGLSFGVLYVGSTSRRKGFDVLIHALACARPFLASKSLTVYCAGVSVDDRQGLQPEMTSLMREMSDFIDFKFLGRVPISTTLAGIDLAFLPAPIESFGRPVAEMAAAGIPICCSENPGHLSIITPGVSAFTFPVGRTDVAGAQLARALLDPEQATQFSSQARESVGSLNGISIVKRVEMAVESARTIWPTRVRFGSGQRPLPR